VIAKLARLALMGTALGLLSACNVVMTEKPLFTQADAAGAPALRPGVWLFFEEPGCKVDDSKPFTEWPDCAGGGLVGAADIRGHKQDTPPDQLETAPYVLATGDPRVMQIQVDVDLSAHADVSASGDGAAANGSTSSSASHSQPYGYAAIRPTKLDSQGRIVAFTLWPVQCGPPPPKDANGDDTAPATQKLLPGLTMKDGDPVCTTTSTAALRAAAKASEAWAPPPPREARWVRDANR
jgi:hypothetical protein